MTIHTHTIQIQITAEYSPPEPDLHWPGDWALTAVEVPGFDDEQNETLWRMLRSDMEEKLIELIEADLKKETP